MSFSFLLFALYKLNYLQTTGKQRLARILSHKNICIKRFNILKGIVESKSALGLFKNILKSIIKER